MGENWWTMGADDKHMTGRIKGMDFKGHFRGGTGTLTIVDDNTAEWT